MINFFLAITNAYFYRLGGASPEDFPYLPKWLVKGYMRPVGTVICFLAYFLMIGAWHWTLLPSAGILAIMIDSYHKWLNPFFKKPTTDAYWFNYLAHGIGISLSILPYVIANHLWLPFTYQIISLPLIITLWSLVWNEVNMEEGGRGFAFISSLNFFS